MGIEKGGVLSPQASAATDMGENITEAQLAAQFLQVSEAAVEQPEPQDEHQEQPEVEVPEVEEESADQADPEQPDEQPEVEDSEDPDDDESSLQAGALSKEKHQRILDKRIAKEREKQDRLRQEVEQLKQLVQQQLQQQQVQQAPQPQLPPDPNNPLSTVSDPNQLAQLEDQARFAKRWASRQLLSREDEFKLGERVMTREEVQRMLDNAEDHLDRHIPQRRNFLQSFQSNLAVAVKEFPWMNDPNTAEYQMAIAYIRSKPMLANDPEAPLIVAEFIEGKKALDEKRKAAGKKATAEAKVQRATAKVPDAGLATASAAAKPRVAVADSGKQKRLAEIQNRYQSGGNLSEREFAQLLVEEARLNA